MEEHSKKMFATFDFITQRIQGIEEKKFDAVVNTEIPVVQCHTTHLANYVKGQRSLQRSFAWRLSE